MDRLAGLVVAAAGGEGGVMERFVDVALILVSAGYLFLMALAAIVRWMEKWR
jgi:hypothetical protein